MANRSVPLDGFGTVAIPSENTLLVHFVPPSGSIVYDGTRYSRDFFNQLEDHYDLFSVPEQDKVQIAGSCLRGVAKDFYRRRKTTIRVVPVEFE